MLVRLSQYFHVFVKRVLLLFLEANNIYEALLPEDLSNVVFVRWSVRQKWETECGTTYLADFLMAIPDCM